MKLADLPWHKEHRNIWSRATLQVPGHERWVMVYWPSHATEPHPNHYSVTLWNRCPVAFDGHYIGSDSDKMVVHRRLDVVEAQCLLNYYLDGGVPDESQ